MDRTRLKMQLTEARVHGYATKSLLGKFPRKHLRKKYVLVKLIIYRLVVL